MQTSTSIWGKQLGNIFQNLEHILVPEVPLEFFQQIRRSRTQFVYGTVATFGSRGDCMGGDGVGEKLTYALHAICIV